MSTIATPRETPQRRGPSSLHTPTNSNRPSLEGSRSLSSSPKPGAAGAPPSLGIAATATATATATAAPSSATSPVAAGAVRRNRAALREYYKLKKAGGGGDEGNSSSSAATTTTPVVEVTGPAAEDEQQRRDILAYSEVPPSEMDRAGFDAEAYVRQALQESGLEALLRTYTRVLSETRALGAEKKGLVYDNYSRLITATETIKKMRATMDPLNPMASTLDPALAHIYTQATALRDALRAAVPPPDSAAAQAARRRAHTARLAAAVLQTPDRLRQLVRAGRVQEAEQAWARPRRLLEAWQAQGVGGADDVAACLADGAAALRGEGRPAGWDMEGDGRGGGGVGVGGGLAQGAEA